MQSDDFGKDLPSVQSLQRKHDATERDLIALQEKVITVFLAVRSDRTLGCPNISDRFPLLDASKFFCQNRSKVFKPA